jgi:hypothetical protein
MPSRRPSLASRRTARSTRRTIVSGVKTRPVPVADRARLGHGVQVALPHALAGHLDEAEVAHRERLGAGPVAARCVRSSWSTRSRFAFVSMSMKSQTMMPPTSRRRSCRAISRAASTLVFSDRLLGVLLAGVAPGVHVDRHERLGGLDDQVAAARQVAAPLEEVADLLLDAELVEQRYLLLVQLHAVDEFRRDPLQVLDDLVVDLLGVDDEASTLVLNRSRMIPRVSVRLAVQQRRRRARTWSSS